MFKLSLSDKIKDGYTLEKARFKIREILLALSDDLKKRDQNVFSIKDLLDAFDLEWGSNEELEYDNSHGWSTYILDDVVANLDNYATMDLNPTNLTISSVYLVLETPIDISSFVKDEPKVYNKYEHGLLKIDEDELRDRVRAMNKEEYEIVLEEIPFEIVWDFVAYKVKNVYERLEYLKSNLANIIK